MPDLTLLVIADLDSTPPASAGGDFAIELAQRAVTDARRSGGFDALVVLGRLPTGQALTGLPAEKTPCVVVPGDGSPERLLDAIAQCPGAPLGAHDGLQRYTAPALVEPPYRYALVRLKGGKAAVEERQLRLPDCPRLFDVHAHTHYAYCSEDVTPAETILRARLFGLAGIALTEHSDQLYLTREEAYGRYAREHEGFWREPRSPEHERMPGYRATVEPLRSDYVKLGIEIELDCAGRPALRASHDHGWDLRLGAVHWTPGDEERLSEQQAREAFLQSTERLLDAGIDVLAHPFRFFRRHNLEAPENLYPIVARMLAAHGVAAEINYHTNDPDPAFFAECIAQGVKIALGSDAHALHEVGDFHPHLAVLREAAGSNDVEHLLWSAPWARP